MPILPVEGLSLLIFRAPVSHRSPYSRDQALIFTVVFQDQPARFDQVVYRLVSQDKRGWQAFKINALFGVRKSSSELFHQKKG
jgi:hypothetical protein